MISAIGTDTEIGSGGAQAVALEEAPAATEALAEGHPGGAFALIP